ncbi:hypothetical protein GCM10010260_39210 [Streptomyces filipinensis]|uniref:RHIM domain-containing protein n=1 Tax=Streptomyces filipinensis TaxID=66887 RepID=A0A918IBX3_9ACTN|nr:hypothetical protein [Streptomyces filipinensis]GGU99150.1 hypothetical protein GCM10010260_39210 [Streptomyces filipinensis]
MIDPFTLVLTALAVGAARGAGETANTAVQDAYSSLKSLLRRTLSRRSGQETDAQLLDRYEEQPELWRESLRELLTEAGIADDEGIIAAAARVLQVAEPEQAAGTNVLHVAGDIHGLAQGNGQTVTMNFGAPSGGEPHHPQTR